MLDYTVRIMLHWVNRHSQTVLRRYVRFISFKELLWCSTAKTAGFTMFEHT
jgi:hypothetical protein